MLEQVLAQWSVTVGGDELEHGVGDLEADRGAGHGATGCFVDHLAVEDRTEVLERLLQVAHRDRVAPQAGQAERVLVAPVLGRPHRGVEDVVVVVEVPVEELQRDAVAVGRVRVQRDVEVTSDPDPPGRQHLPHLDHVVDLVLDPQVVGPVPRVEEELVRHEDLEEDSPHVHETGVPRRLEPLHHDHAAVEAPVVLDRRLEVLVHDVEVDQTERTDRCRHV